GTRADRDIPLPANVRRYYFPGTTHGGGAGGFSSAAKAAGRYELADNPNPQRETVRALMVALIDSVLHDTTPPPTPHPPFPPRPPRRPLSSRPVSWCAPNPPRWAFLTFPASRSRTTCSTHSTTTISAPASVPTTCPGGFRPSRRRSGRCCPASCPKWTPTATS